MGNNPITPDGRTVKAVLNSSSEGQRVASAPSPIDKWELLRELTVARRSFGLSDRGLAVLEALLSFHPEKHLDSARSLVVYPSNATICERANGMADSTMRRHLTQLIELGLMVRCDSPNRKRFSRSVAGTKIAYGFDLSPLFNHAPQIVARAADARELDTKINTLRESISLRRRDLATLVDRGRLEQSEGPWDDLSDLVKLTAKQLRRKPDIEMLEKVIHRLEDAIALAAPLAGCEAEEMSSGVSQIEQHLQNSDKEHFYIESDCDGSAVAPFKDTDQIDARSKQAGKGTASLPPLRLVLSNCTEILDFAAAPIQDWRSLVHLADEVSGQNGIPVALWHTAKTVMGERQAAATFSAMIQQYAKYRKPAGYLARLVQKAQVGKFSARRMVVALNSQAR